MDEELLQTPEEREETGFPVDLTEEEFLHFSMTVAKKMGPLKRQKMSLFLFAAYLIVEAVGLVSIYLESGTWSYYLLTMMGITAACVIPMAVMMPRKILKSSKAAYKTGNHNGYYGEIVVTPHGIMKHIGDEIVTIAFNEQTMYIEDRDFMAFTAANEQRSILLPARCMTADMAKAVREAVFSQDVQMQRHVFARMDALASAPIERRAFAEEAQTLYTVDFQYTEEELTKIISDGAWKRYTDNLPNVALMSCLAGILMAMLQEQLLWFPGLSLLFIFGYMLLTVLPPKLGAKSAAQQPIRHHVALTDRGLELRLSPSGKRMSIAWQGLERAIERPSCVEFVHSGGNVLRIPKRAIDNFDDFRRVVDDHFKKQ